MSVIRIYNIEAVRLSPLSAKEWLDSNPHSVVNHVSFEEESFIFTADDGSYCFWNANSPENVDTWSWETDIKKLRADCSEGGDSEDYPVEGFFAYSINQFNVSQEDPDFYETLKKTKKS